MSNKFEEIPARLEIIEVLESVGFNIKCQRDDPRDEISVTLFSTVKCTRMKHVHLPIFGGKFEDPRGKLPDVINEINAFIKTKLAPLIAEQQEAIKKLL